MCEYVYEESHILYSSLSNCELLFWKTKKGEKESVLKVALSVNENMVPSKGLHKTEYWNTVQSVLSFVCVLQKEETNENCLSLEKLRLNRQKPLVPFSLQS